MKSEKAKKIIAKFKHPLPSYRISFEKHFEIIKVYVVASSEGKKPISWKDFEKLVSISSSYVSANNKFLEDLGFIKEIDKQSGKYYPTEKAILFSKAKEWNEEQAKGILRELILNSWFWESTKQLLDARQKVSKNDLINKLGINSGADRKKHLPSLNVLIEYLKYVELINEENEVITYGRLGLKEMMPKEIIVSEEKGIKVQKSTPYQLQLIIALNETPEIKKTVWRQDDDGFALVGTVEGFEVKIHTYLLDKGFVKKVKVFCSPAIYIHQYLQDELGVTMNDLMSLPDRDLEYVQYHLQKIEYHLKRKKDTYSEAKIAYSQERIEEVLSRHGLIEK